MARRGLRNLALLAVREFPLLLNVLRPLGARPEVQSSREWDAEFESGKWQLLNKLREQAHHLAIAAYFNGLKSNGTVLDVGCAEGVLNVALRKFGYSRYVGIDMSSVAIAAAQRHADETTTFQAISGDDYQTTERFDCIVFDETLNYFPDPAATVERLAAFLAKDGIIIVSLAMTGIRDGLLKLNIWRAIEAGLRVLDETTIYRPDGITWTVKVLARPGH